MALRGECTVTAANGTPVGSLAATVGTISSLGGSGEVFGNRLFCPAGSNSLTGFVIAPTGSSADYAVHNEVYYAAVSPGGPVYNMTMARAIDEDDCVRAVLRINADGSQLLWINETIGGSDGSTLGSHIPSLSTSTSYKITLLVEGGFASVLIDDVEVIAPVAITITDMRAGGVRLQNETIITNGQGLHTGYIQIEDDTSSSLLFPFWLM